VEGALWSQAAAHGRSNYYQQRDCKLPKSCKANLAANRTDDSKYWRNMPGHMRTLERWGEFAGLERFMSAQFNLMEFCLLDGAEMERAKPIAEPLKKATIRRG